MITEQGTVQEIKKKYAVIRVQKSSACDQCSSRGSCDISGKEMIMEVINELNAKAGDIVEISMPEGTLMKASFLVYFLPVIALLIGAFSGNALSGALNVGPAPASILGGFLLMGIVFYFLMRRSRSSEYRARYLPRMTRILTSPESHQTCGSI